MSGDQPNQTVNVRITSLQVSKTVVACVALLVAAFCMYIYQSNGSSAQAKNVSQTPIPHQRVDFDMFPGRYVLNLEMVDLQSKEASVEMASLLKTSLNQMTSGKREMCLSEENAKFNIFSGGLADNCLIDANRSFPGVIDITQTCSNPNDGPGYMTMTLQGTMSAERADMIMAAEFEIPGAGDVKAVLKSSFERIGDCPAG